MNKDLNKLISHYRSQIAKNNLFSNINSLVQVSCYTLILLLLIETIFFLSSPYRINIFTIGLFSFFSLLGLYIVKYIFYIKKLMGNGSDYDIGKKISKKLLKDEDHLINAIELDRSLGYQKSSKDLINKAIFDTTSYLFNNSKTIFNSQKKYILSTQSFLVLIVLATLLFFSPFNSAATRLASPSIHYKPPTPFELYSLSKNLYVVEGDSTSISIAGIGNVPKNIELSLSNDEIVPLKSEDEVYSYSFTPTKDTTTYKAKYSSTSMFSPWSEISTSIDTIFLLKRPRIVDIDFIVSYPAYTEIDDKKLMEEQQKLAR